MAQMNYVTHCFNQNKVENSVLPVSTADELTKQFNLSREKELEEQKQSVCLIQSNFLIPPWLCDGSFTEPHFTHYKSISKTTLLLSQFLKWR